ncbi:hypothetical protein T265_11455 [Opisthorchis viverrini]|uniref:Uncharacterized protein n=1 Tax=Opisthorchis viverrini TaxID=6198 RepID=A0A074YYL7_OPIVI|nr:hypothetical protein T265_11455 [Opisthorchis viverrini]KER19891.1 hypothetical protein T265_11455 [Opisthorchis viverrini]
MCCIRPPHVSVATIFEISPYMYICNVLLIRLLKIHRQPTAGFAPLGAHQHLWRRGRGRMGGILPLWQKRCWVGRNLWQSRRFSDRSSIRRTSPTYLKVSEELTRIVFHSAFQILKHQMSTHTGTMLPTLCLWHDATKPLNQLDIRLNSGTAQISKKYPLPSRTYLDPTR